MLSPCGMAPARAALDIIPIKDIKPGMKGYGRTVFQGSQPVSFPVEVLGISPGGAPGGGDLILIRVSGDEMKHNGGVAQGMSGSPIYINNKLAGALSIAFVQSDNTLAGVTAIESMLDTYDFVDKPGKAWLLEPVEIDGAAYTRIDYTGEDAAPGALHAVTSLTPLAIRGVTPRSYEALKGFFEDSGLELAPFEGMAAGGSGGVSENEPIIGSGRELKPGSSIAVQLVRGDIDISAVGTLTAIDGDRVLAFGHSFFHKGEVEYLLADAPVIVIVENDMAPYKLTNTGLVRGMISQDRGSAVVGTIDMFPDSLVPIRITVEDTDIGRSRTFSSRIVNDRDLLPQLIVAVLVNAADQTIDRFGPGTAITQFNINVNGVDIPIERENMFTSSYDISAESIIELLMALHLIQDNSLKDVSVKSIDAHIKFNSSDAMAAIVESELFDPLTGEPIAKSEEKADDKGKDEKKIDDKDKDKDEDIEDNGQPDDAGDQGGTGEDDDNDGDEIEDEDAPEDGGDLNEDAPDEDEKADPNEDKKENDPDDKMRRADERRDRSRARGRRNLPQVVPGQKLGLKVTIHPFKQEPVEEILYIKVPKDINEGTAIIRVFSGLQYMDPWYYMEGMFMDIFSDDQMFESEHGFKDGKKERKKRKTLEDIFKRFMERDRNNEMVATITSMSARPRDAEEIPEEEAAPKEYGTGPDGETEMDEEDFEAPPPDRAKKWTPWVLSGDTTIRVRVVKDGKEDDKPSIKSGRIEKSRIKSLGDK